MNEMKVIHIRSDNGTNLFLKKRVTEFTFRVEPKRNPEGNTPERIYWMFNPPGASHHGRVWQRLICMVRQILCSILQYHTLDDEELQTLFCEVESILNSHPVTTLSDDHHDLEPLAQITFSW